MVLDYILSCFWGNADEMKDDAGIQMNFLEVVSNKCFFSVTVNSVFYSLNFVSKVLSLAIPFSLDITICYLWFKDVLVLIENVVSSFSTCNLWAIKRYSKSKGICHILNQLLPWQPTRKGRSVKLSQTVLWWISWHRGIYPTSLHSRCQQHHTKVAGFANLMYHCL